MPICISISFVFFLLRMIFSDAAVVTMHCPSIFTIDDSPNKVFCDVNTTELVEAKCKDLTNTLSFVIQTAGSIQQTLCFLNGSVSGKCGASVPENCWCSESREGMTTFAFLYMGDPAHAGGTLTCSVCGSNDPITEDLGNCKNLLFVLPGKSEGGEDGAGNPKSSLLGIMLAVAASLLPKTC